MNKRGGRLVLAGDIGGTKTFLGLFLHDGTELTLLRDGVFINANFADHDRIIGEFIEKNEIKDIEAAAFGVACPVEDNSGSMTNLPWVIDGREIGKRFRIRKVQLLNDLVATGWGISVLKENDFQVLQEGSPKAGNAVLVAAGTGLGEALLFFDGENHLPSASEGGHADFAPTTRTEIELLEYLSELFGHVSYERVLSGPGLENIYSFFRAGSPEPEPEPLRKRFESEPAAAVISDEAINGEFWDCKKALGLFVSVYGAEAGNMALKALATGGVYIGGGIAPKILAALKENKFVESFRKKGRFEDFLSRIPISVILNEKTALIGAAVFAAGLPSRKGGRRSVIKTVNMNEGA